MKRGIFLRGARKSQHLLRDVVQLLITLSQRGLSVSYPEGNKIRTGVSDKACGISGETTGKFGQDSRMHFDRSRSRCIFTYLRGKPMVDTVVLHPKQRQWKATNAFIMYLQTAEIPLRVHRRRCKDAICQGKP